MAFRAPLAVDASKTKVTTDTCLGFMAVYISSVAQARAFYGNGVGNTQVI